jgi:hypothetical protein
MSKEGKGVLLASSFESSCAFLYRAHAENTSRPQGAVGMADEDCEIHLNPTVITEGMMACFKPSHKDMESRLLAAEAREVLREHLKHFGTYDHETYEDDMVRLKDRTIALLSKVDNDE